MDKIEVVRFIRNFIYLLFSQLISYALNFFIALIIAKKAGLTHFGEFFLIATIQNFFILIADFGINTLCLRDISKKKELLNTYLNNVLSIKLLLFIIAYIFMQTFVCISGYSEHVIRLSFIFGLSMLPIGITNLFIFSFRALGRMDKELLVSFFNLLFTGIFLFYIYYFEVKIDKVIMLWVLNNLVLMSFCFFVLKKTSQIKLKFQSNIWKNLLSESKYFLLYTLTSWIYVQIDTIILSHYTSIDSVGLYQAAMKITVVSVFLGDVMLNNLFPFISAKFLENPEKGKYIIRKVSDITIALVWPILLAVIFFSKETLSIVYGKEYLGASTALILLGIGYLFCYGPPYGIILLAIGYQRINFNIAFGAALTNVVLNFILIPKFEIIGAAAATMLTYIGMKCIYSIVFAKLQLPLFSVKNFVFFIIILLNVIIMNILDNYYSIGIFIYIFIVICYIYIVLLKDFRNSSIYSFLRKI